MNTHQGERCCYFLDSRGGPVSAWSRRIDGGGWSGGDGIIPLTKADALDFAERELTTAEIEAGFAAEIADA